MIMKVPEDSLVQRTREALIQLNGELSDTSKGRVKSFYLEYDEDFDDWVANLNWLVPELPDANINADGAFDGHDLLGELCSLGGDKLRQIVAMTYCEYRTQEEYLTQFSTSRWQGLLVELDDAA